MRICMYVCMYLCIDTYQYLRIHTNAHTQILDTVVAEVFGIFMDSAVCSTRCEWRRMSLCVYVRVRVRVTL